MNKLKSILKHIKIDIESIILILFLAYTAMTGVKILILLFKILML